MVRTLAIISDTHLPRGNRRLPDACIARLRAADLIIHAGDLLTAALLVELAAYGVTQAVHGNRDDAEVCAQLPDRLDLNIGGVRLGVLHDAGAARGRARRLRRWFPDADAVIFGHSHTPLLERDPDTGLQIFNPGSPTDKRRQPCFTMGWAEVSAETISFEIVELA
jgi:putative phosphoesterase